MLSSASYPQARGYNRAFFMKGFVAIEATDIDQRLALFPSSVFKIHIHYSIGGNFEVLQMYLIIENVSGGSKSSSASAEKISGAFKVS